MIQQKLFEEETPEQEAPALLDETEALEERQMDISRKGDFAEFYAVTWLWDQGYEVFLNAGCTGPIDLVAFKEGETMLVDVKTRILSKAGERGGHRKSQRQKNLGVVFLEFRPETRDFHWVGHRK